MSTPVNGNDKFKRVGTVITEPTSLIRGVTDLNPLNGVQNFPVPSGGVAAGALTALQLQTAAHGGPLGLGLLLDRTGGTYNLLSSADTNANAAAIQSALGLDYVGAAKLLRFYWVDVPTGDAVLQATALTNITVTSLGETSAVIFETTAAAAGGPQNFQAIVLVSATNVTSGAEIVDVNILQRAGIST